MIIPNELRIIFLKFVLSETERREPDFAPGPAGDPYLQRWWLTTPNEKFNVWVHRFLKSDPDEALHDHSFDSISVLLHGSYREQMRKDIFTRSEGEIIFRYAEEPHKILIKEPVLTLFITGAKKRRWGFVCKSGWKAAEDLKKDILLATECGVEFWDNPVEEEAVKS